MSYDEGLVQRIREEMDDGTESAEKKMFGGICFLVRGNMACGVLKDFLIVRVGPKGYDDALKMPGARVFDITGRIMKGWVTVDESGYAEDEDLRQWVEKGLAFAQSLPPK